MNSSVLYQFKKAGYYISRLLPPKIRKYITPVFSLVGLYGFMKFLLFWTKSKYLISIEQYINEFFKYAFLSFSNFSWIILILIVVIAVLVRQKIMWRSISILYLVVVILGFMPMLMEVLKNGGR